MGELEDSVQRHPAGKAQKETIWDTAWAVSKAMELGREQERERIIKLLEIRLSPITYERHECVAIGNVIALIKGESQNDNETVSFLTEGENK